MKKFVSILAIICAQITLLNAQTSLVTNQCNSTFYTLDDTLNIDPIDNVVIYNWVIKNTQTNNTSIKITTQPNLPMSSVAMFAINNSYSVKVSAVRLDTSWWFPYPVYVPFGASCNITFANPPIPESTNIIAGDCGRTFQSLSDVLTCEERDFIMHYRFRFTDTLTNLASLKIVENPEVVLSSVPAIQYNRTYAVDVSAVTIFGDFVDYGEECLITTPNVPQGSNITYIVGNHCHTQKAMNQDILCINVPGATNYRWKVKNLTTNTEVEYTRNSYLNNFRLQWVPSIANYSTTYDISVKAYVNGSWGEYAQSCFIFTPSVPNTQLQAQQCGQTFTNLAGYLYCNPVALATEYRWELKNLNTNVTQEITLLNGQIHLDLSEIPNISVGTTYEIRVKAGVNGVWGNYSTMCQIIIDANVPNTNVMSYQCGTTLNAINDHLYTDVVPGANKYMWKVKDTQSGDTEEYLRDSYLNNFKLTWLNNYAYGKTYEISVKASIGNTWGEYGDVCLVSTPANFPTTQLTETMCGGSFSLNTILYCDLVSNAQDIEWVFSNSDLGYSYSFFRQNGGTDVNLNAIPGLIEGESYEVKVRAKVLGEWGAFGEVCTISITNGNKVTSIANLTNYSGFEVSTYPNPLSGAGPLFVELNNLNTEVSTNFVLTNAIGEVITSGILVESQNRFSVQLPNEAGFYFIKVQNGTEHITKKIVKQ